MDTHETVSETRLDRGLRRALDAEIAALLEEPSVTDVMCNADGRVFVDRTGAGRTDSGITLTAANADFALRMLASSVGTVITRDAPLLSATMPGSGERVAGSIAPITEQPTLSIRKPPRTVFDLSAFSRGPCALADGPVIDGDDPLVRAVQERRNILIAGSTGSGKTSLLSSLLQIDSVVRDRCLIIEDTREIAIEAPDHVRFLTSPQIGMQRLVQHALRYRPDRIVLGEVRSGDAALEMLFACNTGHSGSFGTIHANSALDALGRLEDLCSTICPQPPRRAIATAIGCVVFVQRTMTGRAISEVLYVDGWQDGTGYVTRSM
ncbi:MAG: Flp pilus assembly complex ATPase component TadA [Rhodospirillales bacterium]|nr:Flp pilus assembly complex ATPase component TadA [Rhodospirillales bacterium]